MNTPKRELTFEEHERLFKLSPWWRTLLTLAGSLFLLVGYCFFVSPPERTTTETQKNSEAPDKSSTKTTTTSAEPSAIVIGLLAGGAAFIAYAATGFKISKFEAPGFKAESHPPPGRNDAPASTLETPISTPTSQPAPVPAMSQTGPERPTTSTPISPPPPPATSTSLPNNSSPPPAEATLPRQTTLQLRYPQLQFGNDHTHTFLLRTSWNGLRILKACQVAAQKGRILKLREVAKIGTEMSYDYAFGFFIASFSAGVVIGAGNPSTGETFINEVDPTLNAKIDEILEGNIKTDPHPEMSNAKRRDLAALTAYLNAL